MKEEIKEIKEKKKFNKKYLMFGVLGLFALALVAAIVVPYLGNNVKVNMEVKSPMLYEISGGEVVDNVLTLLPVYGGESVTFTVVATHLADVDTEVEAHNILRNEDGLTCADIATATVHAVSNEGENGWEATLTLGDTGFSCKVVGPKQLRFLYGETIDVYEPGRIDTMDVSVTFAPNALGTYKFTATPLYPVA